MNYFKKAKNRIVRSKPKPKKEIYILLTGMTINLGDRIIMKSLIDNLRQKGKVFVICNSEKMLLDVYNIKKKEIFLRKKKIELLIEFIKKRVINTPVYYFLPPGHYYKLWRSPSSFKIYIFWSILRLLGVKICRIGVSVFPLNKRTAFYESLLCKLSHYYSVREKSSIEELAHYGITKVTCIPI